MKKRPSSFLLAYYKLNEESYSKSVLWEVVTVKIKINAQNVMLTYEHIHIILM